jgi:hypothetical protein
MMEKVLEEVYEDMLNSSVFRCLFSITSAVAVHSGPVHCIHHTAAGVPCGTISQIL